MKKTTMLFLSLLLVVAWSLPAFAYTAVTPAEGDVAQADAETIAWEALAESEGLPQTRTDDYLVNAILMEDADGVRQWAIVFRSTTDLEPYIVYVATPSAEVLRIAHSSYTEHIAEWETLKGPNWFWSAEEKALFDAIYVISELTPVGRGIPSDGDMAEADVVKIARETLMAEMSITAETLDALKVDTNFFTGYEAYPDLGYDDHI